MRRINIVHGVKYRHEKTGHEVIPVDTHRWWEFVTNGKGERRLMTSGLAEGHSTLRRAMLVIMSSGYRMPGGIIIPPVMTWVDETDEAAVAAWNHPGVMLSIARPIDLYKDDD